MKNLNYFIAITYDKKLLRKLFEAKQSRTDLEYLYNTDNNFPFNNI